MKDVLLISIYKMNKILLTAAVAATLLTIPVISLAQDVTTTPTITPTAGPRKQFRQEVRDLRKEMKGEIKELRKETKDEIKDNRGEFKDDRKDLLKDSSPDARLTLMPSIKADRKAMQATNRGLWTTFTTKRAELVKNFRESVANLWHSVFETK